MFEKRHLRWSSVLLLAWLLPFCGQTENDGGSSESHFLGDCLGGCPSGLSCICGICTTECSDDSSCTRYSSAARCAPSSGSSCSPEKSVCDVECARDDECRSSGDGLVCTAGRCREGTPGEPTGGRSGTGGQASTGGQVSTGGQPATGGQAQGGGGPEGGSGGEGGSSSCERFDDDTAWSIGVEIANFTERTLHVGTDTMDCYPSPLPFKVATGGIELEDPGFCRTPCEGRGLLGGCPAICLQPTAITLAPGEGVSLRWEGRYGVETELTPECVAPELSSDAPIPCERAQQIEQGLFAFSARAGTELDCSMASGECPACEPTDTGGCTTAGARIGGTIVTAEVSAELDASFGVFGPDDVPPNAPVGALNSVQIRFEE